MSPLLSAYERHWQTRPGAACVIEAQAIYSFDQVREQSMRVQAKLVQTLRPGARVALLAPGGRHWVAAFWGILGAGAVVVPLTPLHPAAELSRSVAAAGAELLLYAGQEPEEGGCARLAIEPLAEQPGPLLAPAEAPDAGTLGLLLTTSGTTGQPKLVRLTHAALAALGTLVSEAWNISERDRLLHALPLHHMHGIGIAYLPCALSGACINFLPRFEAVQLWEQLGQVSVFMGVPTMYKKLLDAWGLATPDDQERWSRAAQQLRLSVSGSQALPVQLGEAWRALSGEYPLERYGMTEIGVGLSNLLKGPRVPGSAGRPLPGMQIRLMAGEGAERFEVTGPGQPGEIWVRGPSLFEGYDADAEATDASFVDGWFCTGDTAAWAEDGGVVILGRSSVDIIKSGGYKLSALEIEACLRDDPSVGDVAVIGVPDDTWGECVVACLTIREGASFEPERLRALAQGRLAAYKVPKRFLQFEALPRNLLGKVTKKDLKQLVIAEFPSHNVAP